MDYRKLNAIIKPEIFPLQNIEERVEKAAEAKFITILDVTKGYGQIPMMPRAQHVVAFITNFGLSLPFMMSFGLIGASFVFSKFMSKLRGLEEFCLPYLHHMAIFSLPWPWEASRVNTGKNKKRRKLKLNCQNADLHGRRW